MPLLIIDFGGAKARSGPELGRGWPWLCSLQSEKKEFWSSCLPLVRVDPGQEDSTRSRFHDFASIDGLKGMQRFASI